MGRGLVRDYRLVFIRGRVLRAVIEATIVGGTCWLLGQMGKAIDIPDINPSVLMSNGFTLWYAWYMTTRVLPRKDREAVKEREADRLEREKDRKRFQCHYQNAG